jgi:uncharacterized protein (UPF0332 family)
VEDWELWINMARDSLRAAAGAEAEGLSRSSVSRYYYAAYQAMTAALLYRRVTPPVVDGVRREAWSHADMPELIMQQLAPVVRNRDRRSDLARRLGTLYRMRVIADYVARVPVTRENVDVARRNAGYLVKTAEKSLPRERSV